MTQRESFEKWAEVNMRTSTNDEFYHAQAAYQAALKADIVHSQIKATAVKTCFLCRWFS